MIDIFYHPLFEFDQRSLHFFSVLGRALYTAQHFEMNCRALAVSLRMVEHVSTGSSVEDPVFQQEIVRFYKQTLGKYASNLKQRNLFSEDFLSILDKAVRARNKIAHNIVIGITDSTCPDLDDRIREIEVLVRQIASADKVVATLIHIVNKDPLPSFLNSYENNVVAWVVEKTFEE